MKFSIEYLNDKLNNAIEMTDVMKKHGRFFNTSIILLPEHKKYLYTARYGYSHGSENIKPGNSINEKSDKYGVGANFWWGYWQQPLKHDHGTYIFTSDYNFNNFKLLKLECPQTSIFRGIAENMIKRNDLRIFKKNRDIYIYNSSLKCTYIARYNHIYRKLVFFKRIKWNKSSGNKSKNHGIIDILPGKIITTDWYYKEGVRLITLNYKKKRNQLLFYSLQTKERPVLKYNEDTIILGKGSPPLNIRDRMNVGYNYNVMPQFSFGSPHVLYEDRFIGIGHIKIHTEEKYEYKKGSNIDMFRKNLYRDFRNIYGERYTQHLGSGFPSKLNGYSYLMFFYYLYDIERSSDTITAMKMKISDSYLPIFLGDKKRDSVVDKDWKFTLVFPTGLAINNTDLTVSAGYGDFYSILMKFDVNEIMKLCTYDMENLNLNEYEYKIMGTDNKNVYIENSLLEIKQDQL
jgi:hypothetical protein